MSYTSMKLKLSAYVLAGVFGIAGTGAAFGAETPDDATKAIAALFELQAAFHGAAAGAGVDAATKATHLADMLALWTEDGILVVGSTVYSGKGEPNTASCAMGSLTLCDFFANHAGSFQLGRDWTSLTPTFLTAIGVHGNTADIYFECHYFDTLTGLPTSSASFGLRGQPATGQARKVRGKWLLWFALTSSPPLVSH
jgi:hypothetical protein